MQPSSLELRGVKQTTQHSEFDIYPEKLVQADCKLQHVEAQLSNLINAYGQQNCSLRRQVENNKEEADREHLNGCTLRNGEPAAAGKEETEKKEGLMEKWAKEDQIDELAREALHGNENFYHQKLEESQQRYNSKIHELQSKSVKPVKEQPSQYVQIQTLQSEKAALVQRVGELEEKLVNLMALEEKLIDAEANLKSKDEKITQLNAKIQEITLKLQEDKVKAKEQEDILAQTQQKLHSKQKELLKYIHAESNFAAQQLTCLESALIKEKDESSHLKMEFERKIQQLEENLRQVNFAYEKQKEELTLLKDQIAKKEQEESPHAEPTSHDQIPVITVKEQNEETKATMQGNGAQLKQSQVSSVTSYMKRSRHNLSFSHVLELEKYYFKSEQCDSHTYKQKTSSPNAEKNGKPQMSDSAMRELDNLLEDEGQQQEDFENEKQPQFTKVVSVKSNEPYEASKSDGESDVNMKIAGEILLVPIESMDQIEVGLTKLKEKLIQFKNYAKLESTGQMELKTYSPKVQPREEPQQSLKTTGFPLKQNQKLAVPRKPSEDKRQSNSGLVKLNESIYQTAQELSELCKAVMDNFEQKIIQSQSDKVKQKIQKKKQFDKLNVQVKDQDKLQLKLKQISEQKSETQAQQSQNQNPDNRTQTMKLLNSEVKNLIKNFFHDEEKSLIEDDEDHEVVSPTSPISPDPKDIQTIDNLKFQDQKSLLQILQRLSSFNKKIDERRHELLNKKKQSVQRLFDVIRSMIINFKISYKSMKKIIELKEVLDVKKNKYMHLKLYLESLYKVLEQENHVKHGSEHEIKVPGPGEEATNVFTLYENYEEKLEKLSSQLSKVRMELDYKSKQYEQLKELAKNQLALSTHSHPTQNEIKSNEQIESKPAKGEQPKQVKQPNNNEQNGKINEEQEGELPVIEDMEEMRKELMAYKKRCKELEQQCQSSGKKKTQRIIHIRK